MLLEKAQRKVEAAIRKEDGFVGVGVGGFGKHECLQVFVEDRRCVAFQVLEREFPGHRVDNVEIEVVESGAVEI